MIHLSCVLSALTERWILALELLEEMMQETSAKNLAFPWGLLMGKSVGTMGNMEGFNGKISVGNIMSFQSSK